MRFNNVILRSVCFCLIIFFFILSVGENISYADAGDTLAEKFGTKDTSDYDESDYELTPRFNLIYQEYLDQGLDALPVTDVVIDLEGVRLSEGDAADVLQPREDDPDSVFVYWEDGLEWMEWDIEVEEEGLYELEIEYMPVLANTRRDVRRVLYIDGESPFREAENIVLYRIWHEISEVNTNFLGDEVWPRQGQIIRWDRLTIYDYEAYYEMPLEFHLTEGSHTIRFEYIDEPVKLGEIRFRAVKQYETYDEYVQKYIDAGVSIYGSDKIVFEAEDSFIEKNNLGVRQESFDDPACSPISRGARVFNTIGGMRWNEGNESITWEFEVPEDGLYNIGVKVLQGSGGGLPTYRRIEIDDEIPFDALQDYLFKYSDKWQMEVLGNDDTDYLFYLEKGTHTMTMSLTTGALGDLSIALERDSITLLNLLRKIFLLAGSEPDPNFEYNFEINIPEMVPTLREVAENLKVYVEILDSISTKRTDTHAQVYMMINTIELFLSDHYKMASRIDDLRTLQSNITSLYFSLVYSFDMAIDYVNVGKADDGWYKGINSTFFQRVYTTVINFFRSFRIDYDAVGGEIGADGQSEYQVLRIWSAMGMEWAEELKNLADEDFTPSTGIVLNMNLVPAGQFAATSGGVNVLLLSLASGNAPDLANGVLAAMPVEFAIREAAVDLEQFEDFDEVASRFLPEVLVPMQYKGGTYAIPETMTMQVLFYRKDILEELGLKVPETWDELTNEVLPVLYRNNMNFTFSPDFSMFLFQYGAELYSDDGMKSGLDSPEAFQAFEDFMFLYTGYGLDAYNQSLYLKFRTGEIPMAIDTQVNYLLLLNAAPEIAGRWSIAPIPGTRQPDGTIDHSTANMVTGSGQANQTSITDQTVMIFNDDPVIKQNAWEFIKWWTSAETQTRFSENIEAQISGLARWFTANLEAYQNLPWEAEDLATMKEMWKWYKGAPVVLGSYFTMRHIYNAWTNVFMQGDNPRDALEEAVKEINIEMRRKQEEYGIYAED